MNIPLDATAEFPEEQKKALLESIEKTQIRDRFHFVLLSAEVFSVCDCTMLWWNVVLITALNPSEAKALTKRKTT